MRPVLAPLLAGLLACQAATPPDRPPAYDYGIRLRDGTILSFRWPEYSLPVRIWVQPHATLRFAVEEAIAQWEGASLYGEFTGVIVADPAVADVHVRVGDAYAADPSSPSSCRGLTRITVALDTTIILPFETRIDPRLGADTREIVACMALAATHELGHALGLFQESDDPNDLMYVPPSPAGFSERDLATFSKLYHSPVTVRLPPSR